MKSVTCTHPVAKRLDALYWSFVNDDVSPQPELPPLTPAQKRPWRKIEWDFHVRAFSEEMALINFLPEKKRKAAVAEMIDHARCKGVDLSRPALGLTP